MAKSDRYQNRIELLQGTLDFLVLQTLQWGRRGRHCRFLDTPGSRP